MKGYNFSKINKFNKSFIENGFVYLNNNVISKELSTIKKIIKKIYKKKDEYYTYLDHDNFYSLNIKALDKINKVLNVNKLQRKCAKFFAKELQIKEKFKIQSFISLVITRPAKNKATLDQAEFVGMHRENFYGNPKYVNFQINLWFPIFEITKLQNFKYVEKSHNIPDKNIRFIKKNNIYVKKNSMAHKCGLNYAPKKIISGVPFSKTKRFNVPKKSFLAFNSNIVHGGGKNLTNKIRFAFCFGIVGVKHLKNIKAPINFRSGKPHYIN